MKPVLVDYVIFTAAGRTTRGLGYTGRGATTFGVECSRQLVGKLWTFTAEISGTAGDCAVGYEFQGSG